MYVEENIAKALQENLKFIKYLQISRKLFYELFYEKMHKKHSQF